MAAGAEGRVVQVIGTVVDVEFPPDQLPSIFNALDLDLAGEKLVLEVEQQVGNSWGALPRARPDRGADARRGCHGHRPAHRRPRGRAESRPAVQRHRRRAGRPRRRECQGVLAHPPRPSRLRRAEHDDRGAGDRREGAGPHLPVHQGREGRRVRRRGRRQDGHHPGAHPQHRGGSTAATPCSPVWASARARGTTSGTRCRSPAC